jgi:arabinofuranosyltransferase
MVFLLVAWFLLVRPRRIALDLLTVFALPVVYEIFRMGFYASLVPNTALAKDAGGLHVSQGWAYVLDFVDAYRLLVTAVLIAAVVAIGLLRNHDRRMSIAVGAMVLGGLANGLYITLIGGDYMHGRLLLPAFFAIALPASIAVRRVSLSELGLCGLAAAWALVSIVWFRPPPPSPGYVVAPITDWRALSGARMNPVDAAFGLNGRQAAEAYARGVRGYFPVATTEPLPANDPNAFIYTLGSIGVPAYDAGRKIWVIDIGGLAEPLAARTSITPGRPAGHRKQVDDAWYAARFTPPSPDEDPKITAARHALECGQLKQLMDGVDGGMSVGRFLSNIFDSFSNTRLHVPADPIEAEHQFCKSK